MEKLRWAECEWKSSDGLSGNRKAHMGRVQLQKLMGGVERLGGLSKNGEAQMSWLHIWKRSDGPGAYGKYELSENGKAKMGQVEL